MKCIRNTVVRLRAIEGIEMWGVWVGMVEYEGVGTGGWGEV